MFRINRSGTFDMVTAYLGTARTCESLSEMIALWKQSGDAAAEKVRTKIERL